MANIENKDTEIDNERRQTLCALLGIPPLLLGVTTVEQIMEIATKQRSTAASAEIATKKSVDAERHQAFLDHAQELHQHATAVQLIDIARFNSDELYRQVLHINSLEQRKVYALLYDYHIFLSCELREIRQFNVALAHLDNAMDLADYLNDDSLSTVCQIHQMRIFEVMGRAREAVRVFDIDRLGKQTPALKSMGFCYMSQLYGEVASTEVDKKAAMALVERGGSFVLSHPEQIYVHGLDSSLQGYYLRRAHTQIAIGQNREAQYTLDRVEYKLGTWWQFYHDYYYAQSYANLGYHETATTAAMNCAELAQKFSSPMNSVRVGKIYNQLVVSPYGGDSDVLELGRMLGR